MDEAPSQPCILVIGTGGQLGQALLRLPAADGRVKGVARADCDVTDRISVGRAIAAHKPAIVINASAYTAVDRAESEPDLAFAVNRDGPSHLATACKAHGAVLIHVSTDYVFDGSGDRPWHEGDPTAPLGIYGASKLAGEVAVRNQLKDHLIVRTSWVYSATGANFVKTMLRVGAERERLTIVRDQRGCPTAADDLARALLGIAVRVLADRKSAAYGTYHFCGLGETTWFDFAAEVFRQAAEFGRSPPELIPIPTADYPTPARRPANSVLDCTRIVEAFGVARPAWQQSLQPVIAALCGLDRA